MSKLILLILVAIGGYYYYSTYLSTSSPSSSDLSPQTQEESSGTAYVSHTDSALADSLGKRRVLFFYAAWCPTCRPVDQELRENVSSLPSDLVVIRVNYNDPSTDQNEKDLAKQYGITYQHTFVQIDDAGEVLKRWNGGGLSQLLANIDP